MNLSTSGAGSRVTTPQAEARVEQRSEAVVAYDEKTSEGRFAAYRGEMRVAAADGATRKVGELEQVRQRGSELSAAKKLPEAPLIIAPEDNVEVALERSERLALRWRKVSGAASYALQVSHNRLFVENIIDVERRTKTSAMLGLKREGSFVWRVAALDRGGERGPWSPAYRFRVVGSGSLVPPAVGTSSQESREPLAEGS